MTKIHDKTENEYKSDDKKVSKFNKKRNLSIIIGAIFLFLIVISIPFSIAYLSILDNKPKFEHVLFDEIKCESSHETYNFNLNLTIKNYKKYSIAVDNAYCSTIGKNVLAQDGSAVDAAIAAGFCNGVMNAQSAGIGGGHFMVIYLREKQKAYAIDARETAPLGSYQNMFFNKSSLAGGLASGIPGEIYGYWEAHKLAGKLPWKSLFKPTIDMCRNGFSISNALGNAIKLYESSIRKNKELSELFINKETNEIYKINDTIKMTKLADTLESISENGLDYFYNGKLTKLIVNEINENGGNVTLDDFKKYQARVTEAISVNLDNDYTIMTSTIPSSGLLVSFIMKLMRGFRLNKDILNDKYRTSLFYHRLIESFKHTFAQRFQLGDEPDNLEISNLIHNLQSEAYTNEIRTKINDFKTYPASYYSQLDFKPDHGTAHLSVLAHGDAVSLTSTINTYFGAKYSGKYTGIIYNNQMDDFSTPNQTNYFGLEPSKANYIKPLKRPMSSMSPIIIKDSNGDVRLVLGASGGSKIITSVAQVAIKSLWLDMNIKDSIDGKRIHHQIYPEYLQVENGFDLDLQKMFNLFGHKQSCFEYGGSIVQGIDQKGTDDIFAYSDPRKGGIPDGH